MNLVDLKAAILNRRNPAPAYPPHPIVKYTGGAGGWCPGHEPMFWEQDTATKAAALGYWQSAGGWIYSPSGTMFVDWGMLAEAFEAAE